MKFRLITLCIVLCSLHQTGLGDLTDNIEYDESFFKEIPTPQKKQKKIKRTEKRSLKESLKNQIKDAKSSSSASNKTCKIYFKGEQFRGSRENSLIELKGNVIVTRCGLEVRSDEARIYLEEEGKEVQEIKAKGNVRLKNYDVKLKENINATGNELVYVRKKNLVSLIGTNISKATLKKGKDKFFGPTIEYDIESGWVKAKKVEGVVHGGSL